MFLSSITATSLTETSTTAKVATGSLYWRGDVSIPTAGHRGFGGQVWRYVKNGDASSITAGMLVVRKTGETEDVVVPMPTTPVSRTYARGVAQHTIAAGSYGWILVRGAGLYVADTGGTTINHVLIAGNAVAGNFDSQVNTTDETAEATQSYGIVITAATATNTGIGLFNQIGL